MPWPEVKCNLNYKDKCPGIIYKKDFAKYRKANRRVAPKKRTEVGSTGICWTCANAQRSEVRDARRNAGNQAGTVSGSLGPDAGVRRVRSDSRANLERQKFRLNVNKIRSCQQLIQRDLAALTSIFS